MDVRRVLFLLFVMASLSGFVSLARVGFDAQRYGLPNNVASLVSVAKLASNQRTTTNTCPTAAVNDKEINTIIWVLENFGIYVITLIIKIAIWFVKDIYARRNAVLQVTSAQLQKRNLYHVLVLILRDGDFFLLASSIVLVTLIQTVKHTCLGLTFQLFAVIIAGIILLLTAAVYAMISQFLDDSSDDITYIDKVVFWGSLSSALLAGGFGYWVFWAGGSQ